MDESIYHLVPRLAVVIPKPPLYHSKVNHKPFESDDNVAIGQQAHQLTGELDYVNAQHDGRIHPEEFEMGIKRPRKFATMGLASGTILSDPAQYLKSHDSKLACSQGNLPCGSSKLSGSPLCLMPSAWTLVKIEPSSWVPFIRVSRMFNLAARHQLKQSATLSTFMTYT
jgi:hypothetical protein